MLSDIKLICREYVKPKTLKIMKMINMNCYNDITNLYRYEPLKFIVKNSTGYIIKNVYIYINYDECYRNVNKEIQKHVINFLHKRLLGIHVLDINDFIDFIRIYKSKLNWKLINERSVLKDVNIVEFEKYINWDKISEYNFLHGNTVSIYKNKLNWEIISKNKLTYRFIKNNIDKVHLDIIYKNPKISDTTKERIKKLENKIKK